MAGPGAARFYSSTFVQTTLSAGISPSTLTFNVGVTTGAPGTPFAISVDQNTSSEELMLVTNVAGNTYTVTRAIGGTVAQSHSLGASVVHVMYSQDLTDAGAHIGTYDGVHGLASGSLVVGTNDTQTLFNKTLQGGTINSATLNNPTLAGTINTGAISSSAEISATDFKSTGLTGAVAGTRYVGATASGAPVSGGFLKGDFVVDQAGIFWVCITAGSPGTWAAVVGTTYTQTLTNKTLTAPNISAMVLTGASTGGGSLALGSFIQGSVFIAAGATGATAASTYAGGTASGAPTTGTHSLGDFVIDQTGNIWVCVTAGTPGTWQPVGGGQGVSAVPISSNALGTATSGTTDTLDTVLGTYQFTAVAGRRYRVIMTNLFGNGTVAADQFACRIRDSGSSSTPTTASTAVVDSLWIPQATGTPGRTCIPMEDTFISGSSGTHTLGFFAQRVAGTGVFTPTGPVNATGTGVRKLWVEDLGTV